MEYKDTTKNMKQIGEELGVKNILEGGIQKAGTRVRINAQLIDAETDEHLWADSFDRELTTENIFDIQSEIALAITQAMQLQLAPETAQRIATAPTENVEAYREYMAARAIENDSNLVPFEVPDMAISLLLKAVELDPAFALAWVELADQYQEKFWFMGQDEASRQASIDALQRAMEIDPEMPEIHYVRG